MRELLVPSGYTVSTADNGREAIRLLKIEAPDLVITDIVMPDGDGVDVIMALRKKIPSIPVIAISGGGFVDADTYLLIARGYGVQAILKKPITRDELVMAIKTVEASS